MKKKLLTVVLVAAILSSMGSSSVFAEVNNSDSSAIETVEELKAAISENFKDGVFTKKEKQKVLERTAEEAVNCLVLEKLDTAIALLNDTDTMTEMHLFTDGSEYARYTYDLGDNCEMIVELQDREESALFTDTKANPMATSGSNEVWKEYGNRLFPATATIVCNVATASFQLENHYKLSVNGIDEIGGKAFATWKKGTGLLEKGEPTIVDSIARTPGASDVNMYCTFACKSGSVGPNKYKLDSTVKYLSHDKTGKRIKVGHAWSLKKVA